MSDDLILGQDTRNSIRRWNHSLQRTGDRLTPMMLVKPWIVGLREAGVNAAHARNWTRGVKSFPVDVPFVIEFDCPYGHRTEDRRRLAKVQLIAEDDGWVTYDPESSCTSCDHTDLLTWLITCPRCEAGEESKWHPSGLHLGTEHRHGTDPKTGQTGVVGDVSPLSFVNCEFDRLRQLAEARWWTEHTQEAIDDYRAFGQYDFVLHTTGDVEEDIRRKIEAAQKVLSVPERKQRANRQSGERTAWSAETAATWLDGHSDADGNPLVLSSASQRDAWLQAKAVAGHPPKNLVERAQTLRKNRIP